MKPTYILGLSAFYHDSAACLLRDGEIVAAAQEERFTRKKGDSSFPESAVDYCLRVAEIHQSDLDFVAFYDKPLLKFERILDTYMAVAPRGLRSFLKAGPLWIKDKLYTDSNLRSALNYEGTILYSQHHESHAASAFLPSPFKEAAILTMDGVGEWATASIGIGRDNEIKLIQELHWPDSLGLLYSAFTYYLGFKVNSGEYKVMGLAPYGEPEYVDTIYSELMDLKKDGSFRLNQEYFNYLSGLTMTSPAFHHLFGGLPRAPESNLRQRDMDLARSIQVVCEEIMLRMALTAHRKTGMENLCLAGGVALNCVGNGRLLREGPFSEIWIQPAAGDAGGALGAAQLAWYRYCGKPRRVVPGQGDAMMGAYLGPDYTEEEIGQYLKSVGARFHHFERAELLQTSARFLADGSVVGWFNGRAEFGPRALGSRSILGDARNPKMQAQMNLKTKLREGFRPFAPSVLCERISDYFELDRESPYMLIVAPVRSDCQIPMAAEYKQLSALDRLNLPRSDIPAVTHIDYTARIHTVSRDRNADYYDLIKEFETITGCGVLVNTSFNVRGEPVVCTPADAYCCFMRTHIDYLVLGPFLLDKKSQPEWYEPRPKPAVRPGLSPREGRKFALTVGSGFAVLGLIVWGAGNNGLGALLFGIGSVFILAGIVLPGRLTLLHRTWMELAKAISRVTIPITMSLVYLLIFAPLGGIRRLVGRNPLVYSAGIDGYWKDSDPEQNGRENLERQF